MMDVVVLVMAHSRAAAHTAAGARHATAAESGSVRRDHRVIHVSPFQVQGGIHTVHGLVLSQQGPMAS